MFETLYLSRLLKNDYEFRLWASKYFSVIDEDLHVTIAYSKAKLDWFSLEEEKDNLLVEGGPRSVERFGDAFVLRFSSKELDERHEEVLENGGSSDYPDYKPHVTISYLSPLVPIEEIEPYQGALIFSEEKFEKLDENYLTSSQKDDIMLPQSKILKINEEERIVFGWASVIEKNDEVVVDTQSDSIESGELVTATTEFMKDARASHLMHTEQRIGSVIHSFPLTKEIAKSLGIESEQYGWIVGVYIESDEIWDEVKKGKWPAFSIGGQANRVEVE